MKKITVTKKTTAKVVGGLAKYIVLIFIFAFLLFPVYWMLVTALKTNRILSVSSNFMAGNNIVGWI